MKQYKIAAAALFLLSAVSSVQAQNLTLTRGTGEAQNELIKNTTPISFTLNGDHYFINRFYDKSIMNYHLKSFDAKGAYIAKTNMEVNPGTFNNTNSIDDLAVFTTKGYALVEHLEKATGKNTLLARAFDRKGKIADAEVELMSIPFEKIMNSGYNYSDVSADLKTLVVVGEMPFVKEQPAQFKIALYDQDLKKIKEGEITLPGENTKNKSISAIVANDGTVYIVKKGMTKKGEMTLAFYQWTGGTDVKEYTLDMAEPNYPLSYVYEVNDNNEFIISGLYYERKTVSLGTVPVGVFYLTNKGKSEKVSQTFALEGSLNGLTSRKLLVNGNTVFLAAEQYKEERITPPASSAGTMNWDYDYDYEHNSEYVIAMNIDGTKKFQLQLSKNFKARNFDKQYYAAYHIINGKFTIIYNDETKKYLKESGYQYMIPVLVQITNDGLMQSPVVFKGDLQIDREFFMTPVFSTVEGNQLSMLMSNNGYSRFIGVKVEDK